MTPESWLPIVQWVTTVFGGAGLFILVQCLLLLGGSWVAMKLFGHLTSTTNKALAGFESFPATMAKLEVALTLYSDAARRLAEEAHAVARAVDANLQRTQTLHDANVQQATLRHQELLQVLRGAGRRGAGGGDDA